MYFEKLELTHFRKFNETDNQIMFVKNNLTDNGDKDKVDVGSDTTLIVGKNNVGKTTIVTALDKLINKGNFKVTDFNYRYLDKWLNEYKKDNAIVAPYIGFKLTVYLDDASQDLVTNLFDFLLVGDLEDKKIDIIIKYEVSNEIEFKERLKHEKLEFDNFLDILDNTDYQINYYDKSLSNRVKDFKLSNLMRLTNIQANHLKNDHCLSDAFNKIISYNYDTNFKTEKKGIINSLLKINKLLTNKVQDNHQKKLTDVLKELISMKHVQVNLHADITFDKLMNGLFKYEYKEYDKNIPEDQFGLGYTNLIMIIASIMDYIAKYPKSAFNSHINLISIEEPEVFMHPQMQELFIENINKALTVLLKNNDINVNTQLIISTHSPHILNSKIHSSNSFNNICYITENSFDACAINLNNEVVVHRENGDDYKKDIAFLKKHIKFKTSELFFSDAVIFVEGFAEELLIPLYIEKLPELSHRYISVFNINGAHGRVYEKLIYALKIPTLMITDLDIKRTDDERENFKQFQSLDNVETTNQTLSYFRGKISELTGITGDFIEKGNLYIAYQGKMINDYYATSFEEAFILQNYNNKILNSALVDTKPTIYGQIVEKNDYEQNKLNSYKWQVKLSEDKGKFANNLFFEITTADKNEDIPELPEYISNGLKWLERELGKNNV